MIVPATAYLEMAIAAGAEAFGARPLTLGGIKLHAPLALDPDTVARTQTVLTGSLDGGLAFAVQSRKVGAAGADAGRGRCTRRAGWPPPTRPRSTLDLEAIRARCSDEVTGEDFYRRLAAARQRLGPVLPGPGARSGADLDEAIAEVRAPAAVAGDLERYRFHPALADAAGHALAATIPLERSAGPLGGAFVGGALDRFVFRRAPQGRLFSHARRRDVGGPGNVLTGDVRLVDETGAVVAEVQGARLWYLDEGVPDDRRGHARASALRRSSGAGSRWRRPPPPVTSGG